MADVINDVPVEVPPEETPSTALATQKPRGKNGAFVKQTKLTKAQKSTETFQNVLTRKNKETGKTTEEELVEHLIEVIKSCGKDELQAAHKALETIEARAWGRVAPSQQELERLTRNPVAVIVLTDPSLSHPVERYEDRALAKPAQPSFADAPFIDGEVVETHYDYPIPPKVDSPKVKPVAEEPEPPCSCAVDSPVYCVNLLHRPEGMNRLK